MKRDHSTIYKIVLSAVVGALYFSLTVAFLPLSYGLVQFRFSEALCLLPFYAPSTAVGLFVGCLLANFFSPNANLLLDIVLGSLATLGAAVWTSRIKRRMLSPLPTILVNAVVVGAILSFSAGVPADAFLLALLVNGGQVALGETVITYALGIPLLYSLSRISYFRQLFPAKFEAMERG